MRELDELARDIDRFTLESRGIPALRAHIRENWTIDEILFFKLFTHCGTFSPPGGAWNIEYPCGHIASTALEMLKLVALFDELQAEAWAYMGARLCADMKGDTPGAALLCDSYKFGGMTLRALEQTLPAGTLAQMAALVKQIAGIKGDTGFLAGEERRRKKAREKAAEKAAAARAEAEEGAEEKPYKQRIEEALGQVDKLVANGKDDLAACRYVCKHYGEKLNQKTGAVIPGGLNKMNGDPMPPKTLRDYYRRRRGTRKRK